MSRISDLTKQSTDRIKWKLKWCKVIYVCHKIRKLLSIFTYKQLNKRSRRIILKDVMKNYI